jgi:phosphopantetheinyl transferase
MTMRVQQGGWPTGIALALEQYDVVVRTASLTTFADELDDTLDLLAPAERARFAGYGNALVGRRFACGRRLVRVLLADALGVAPREVPLREGLHGKPYLTSTPGGALWFSVSHCEELLVFAASRVADVGVDVERARAFEQWERVAERVLDPEERRHLERVVRAGEDPSTAFLRLWCRVESELKAIGCGIAGLEAHRAGERPRGLRLADLTELPMPAEVAATGARYQAAVALCAPWADQCRQSSAVPTTQPRPTSSPTSASTA